PRFSIEDIMNMITGGELSTAEINLMRDLGLVGLPGVEEGIGEKKPMIFPETREEFIDQKIKLSLDSDKNTGTIQAMSEALVYFSSAFRKLKPAIIVLLGDRYETFSAAAAAYVLKIPIAHLHGGELSQGALDDAFRHSITKLATFHFPAAEIYRKRIIQLGENPKNVFNYGAPGLDNLYKIKLLNKKDLARALNFDLTGPMALVTYHPATLENLKNASSGVKIILKALKESRVRAVFSKANADHGGRAINREIAKFCEKNSKDYRLFANLGTLNYLSCLKNFDLIIGNSSSGIIEAPSFYLPSVNIGDRQQGRARAENIIDAKISSQDIKKGIKKALSPGFRKKIKNIKNPYLGGSSGRASFLIKEKLKQIDLNQEILKKKFYDLAFKINQ
ncbi:UDP-N-acetylglucosamine 2-epimerase (hydrolyzing), partial [Patescibacteria group bacterium]|nr:UDP-N-acetylglucosamine 2-epimerase (hydrolyzing) [Patescibacteria group bacterium]